MNINAAILWEQGAPLSVEGAELGGPRAGEVLVELKEELMLKVVLKKMEKQNLVEDAHENIVELDQDYLLL